MSKLTQKRISLFLTFAIILTAFIFYAPPVKVDAATGYLGYTTVGSTNNQSNANDINAFKFQATSSMTATQMKVYLANALTGKMKLAIYSDAGNTPGTLLMGTGELTNPGIGWQTFTLTSSLSITSGTYYWLCEWANASYATKCETTGGSARSKTVTYGSWPVGSSISDGPWTSKDSIYVEGTIVSSTPTPTPTVTPTPTPTATPTPTPTPTGSAVYVNNITELKNAIDNANSNGGNKEIICNNGTYNLSNIGGGFTNFAITANNITVRGNTTADRDNVILRGDAMSSTASIYEIFRVSGSNFRCENMTLKFVRWHAIQIAGESDADSPVIRNVHFMDTYQQMIKISSDANPSQSSTYSDNGLIENCLFEYSAGQVPNYYTCAIDGHHCKTWTVRNSTMKDIKNPGSTLTEPTIHFWNGSTGVTIEGCTISNSERGIYIGMGTDSTCSGCTIKNNTVDTVRDVGIGIENAPNTVIDNNTCHTANYPNSIEYRWAGTTGTQITNNKTTGGIVPRDGATASKVSGNTII